jgi:hypothetical protein
LGVDELVCGGGVMPGWCVAAAGRRSRAEFHHPAAAQVHGSGDYASGVEKKSQDGGDGAVSYFFEGGTVRFHIRPKR